MLKGYMIFPIIKVIKKIVTKDDLKNNKSLFKKIDTTNKTDEEIAGLTQERGLDIIWFILDRLPSAENEIFEVIGLQRGITAEEAKQLDMNEIIQTLSELVSDKGFMSVFTLAMK